MSLEPRIGEAIENISTLVEHSSYLRWFHELLFSLNVALLVVPVASVRMKYPVGIIGRSLFNFACVHWPFTIPRMVRNAEPTLQYFVALVLTSAALLFLLLRITARLSLSAALLRIVPGVVAIAGLPVAVKLVQPLPLALLTEAFAAAICVLLYLYGRWNVPTPISILLLALHFGFWSWGGLHQMFFWLVYPVIGFCSTAMWAIYVKQSEQRPLEMGADI